MTKQITKKVFIDLKEHDFDCIDNIHKEIPDHVNPNDFVEAELTYTVPTYLLRLRAREYNGNIYHHLINNEPERILGYGLFMNLLRHLQRVYPTDQQHLDWNIYPGQPIWEFNVDYESLKEVIEKFHSRIVVEFI
jgi:hypothetical protein